METRRSPQVFRSRCRASATNSSTLQPDVQTESEDNMYVWTLSQRFNTPPMATRHACIFQRHIVRNQSLCQQTGILWEFLMSTQAWTWQGGRSGSRTSWNFGGNIPGTAELQCGGEMLLLRELHWLTSLSSTAVGLQLVCAPIRCMSSEQSLTR